MGSSVSAISVEVQVSSAKLSFLKSFILRTFKETQSLN